MTPPKHAYAGGPGARYVLLGSAFYLTAFGLLMIYSASSVTATVREGASWHYLARQLVFIGLSAPIAWFLSRFDYRRLRNTSWVLWVGGVVLLVVTLLLGIVRGGARRWIPLGLFSLQPSELAKIACVLLVSSIAIEWMQRKTPTNTFLGRVGMAVGVPAVLVMLQPDFGTTLTLIASVGIVLILAGIDWKWVVGAVAGVVAFAALAIAVEPYRAQRFLAFLDPWSDPQGRGYQTVQALLAFGTGGIDGVGLGLSRQKFFYLPEAHNDFILAIIGEEIGLLGTLSVVAGIAAVHVGGLPHRDRYQGPLREAGRGRAHGHAGVSGSPEHGCGHRAHSHHGKAAALRELRWVVDTGHSHLSGSDSLGVGVRRLGTACGPPTKKRGTAS